MAPHPQRPASPYEPFVRNTARFETNRPQSFAALVKSLLDFQQAP